MPSNLFATQDADANDTLYPHRYTLTQRYALSPTDGTLVYDTTCRCLFIYNVDRWYPAQPIDPKNGFLIHEEWANGIAAGDTGWTVLGSGGSGNGFININSTNAPGQFYISQTDAGAYSSAIYGNSYSFGAQKMFFDSRVTFGALSTGAQEYIANVGFADTVDAAAAVAAGIYFCYDRATDGNFWSCKTTNGTGTTKTVTSVAPVALTYNQLSVAYYSGSVKFYIDGVLVATHTTKIPGDGEYNSPKILIAKTVGAGTNIYIVTDFFSTYSFFDTRR